MMKHKVKCLFIAVLFYFHCLPLFSDTHSESGLWDRTQQSFNQTWDSNNYEVYIPVNTWHNRNYYSANKIDEFNEQPWGLGIGKYRFDENNNWHAIYAIGFLDSHNHFEPIVGYGFQKIWRPLDDWRLGLGYTLGVTLREDFNYMPLPVVAPLISVAYKKLAVQSTYILGGDGFGNILFTWLRWQLE